jgi:hypothetical protein
MLLFIFIDGDLTPSFTKGRRGRDRMVVGITTTFSQIPM